MNPRTISVITTAAITKGIFSLLFISGYLDTCSYLIHPALDDVSMALGHLL